MRIRIDAPVYPDVARTAQIEGTVILRVLVGRDGKVKDVIIIEGSGGPARGSRSVRAHVGLAPRAGSTTSRSRSGS
jgi:TonB family protein